MLTQRSLEEAVALRQHYVSRLRQRRKKPDWDRYQEIYDPTVGQLIPYQRLITNLVALGEIEAGMKIVDVACGTGNLMEEVQLHRPDVTVHGFDIGRVMLEIAQNKFEHTPTFQVHVSDLNTSQWVEDIGEGEADVAFSVNTLYMIRDPAIFLGNVRRALRPGGRLVITNPSRGNLLQIFDEHLRLGGAFTDLMGEMIEINLDIVQEAKEGDYTFYSEEALIDLLENARLRPDTWFSDYVDINTTVVAYAV